MLRNTPIAIKLMLSLALTVAVAVGAMATAYRPSTKAHLSSYVRLNMHQRMTNLVPVLEEHFAREGSWGDAQRVTDIVEDHPVMGGGSMHGQRMGAVLVGAGLLVTDADGFVVYDSAGGPRGRRIERSALSSGLPLAVGDQTVGYLTTTVGPQEERLLQQLNRSVMWAGGVAGLVALLLGLALTRTVTGPLSALRNAAQRIGSGDLSHRVPVTSSDEIGDLAKRFNEMAAALEQEEQVRRTMVADIAHELRTPLSVIQGQLEAIQDGVFPLSMESIHPIHDQAILLGRLVDDLRDLALADAGRLQLQRSEVALDRLLARVSSGFQPEASEKGVHLALEISQDLPTVNADGQRLEQVFGNLLKNALRYTPVGGSIISRAWTDASDVVVSVSDTGIGISESDLPRVFDRFYRADRARTRTLGGTGLGLAIAKQLVESHGGRIIAQSDTGQGATFTVRLPIRPA